MLKIAYFLFRYSESTGGRNQQLPQELRNFKSRKAVLEACHPKRHGGRTLTRFIGSVEGDIGGFRDWEAGNRPDHPHSGVLRRYISPDAKREVLWNEVKQFFPQELILSLSTSATSAGSQPAAVKAAIEPLRVSADLPAADELLEDAAEFEVQNLRQVVEVRQKQSIFRQRVLDNFGNQCCLSRISEPCLLIASHIVPWAKRADSRLNPRNGILLNVVFDKLFDRGLISFNDDLSVIVVDWADQCSVPLQEILSSIKGQNASRPKKMPRSDFLAYHREFVFKKRPNQEVLTSFVSTFARAMLGSGSMAAVSDRRLQLPVPDSTVIFSLLTH